MSAEWTYATAGTGNNVSRGTLTIDFRPYQHAAKVGVAFTDLITAMLDTERHLEAMRGES